MDQSSDGIVLTADGEAERLWRLAEKAFVRAPGSVAELCDAINLGVRVVEIAVVNRLQHHRNRFPLAVSSLLISPPAEIDLLRDLVYPPRTVGFVDVIDLLSDEPLLCVSPTLHQHCKGDHACREARETTREVIGFSLSENERRPLMLIGAYRNRLFFLPPPVRIVPDRAIDAFPSLAVLADRLFAAKRAVPV